MGILEQLIDGVELEVRVDPTPIEALLSSIQLNEALLTGVEAGGVDVQLDSGIGGLFVNPEVDVLTVAEQFAEAIQVQLEPLFQELTLRVVESGLLVSASVFDTGDRLEVAIFNNASRLEVFVNATALALVARLEPLIHQVFGAVRVNLDQTVRALEAIVKVGRQVGRLQMGINSLGRQIGELGTGTAPASRTEKVIGGAFDIAQAVLPGQLGEPFKRAKLLLPFASALGEFFGDVIAGPQTRGQRGAPSLLSEQTSDERAANQRVKQARRAVTEAERAQPGDETRLSPITSETIGDRRRKLARQELRLAETAARHAAFDSEAVAARRVRRVRHEKREAERLEAGVEATVASLLGFPPARPSLGTRPRNVELPTPGVELPTPRRPLRVDDFTRETRGFTAAERAEEFFLQNEFRPEGPRIGEGRLPFGLEQPTKESPPFTFESTLPFGFGQPSTMGLNTVNNTEINVEAPQIVVEGAGEPQETAAGIAGSLADAIENAVEDLRGLVRR